MLSGAPHGELDRPSTGPTGESWGTLPPAATALSSLRDPDRGGALDAGLPHHFLQPRTGGKRARSLGGIEFVGRGHVVGIPLQLVDPVRRDAQGLSLGIEVVVNLPPGRVVRDCVTD